MFDMPLRYRMPNRYWFTADFPPSDFSPWSLTLQEVEGVADMMDELLSGVDAMQLQEKASASPPAAAASRTPATKAGRGLTPEFVAMPKSAVKPKVATTTISETSEAKYQKVTRVKYSCSTLLFQSCTINLTHWSKWNHAVHARVQ